MSANLERYKTRLNESNAMKEEKSEYYNFDCSVCKRVTRHWDVFGDMSKLKCNSCGEYRTLETEEKSDLQLLQIQFYEQVREWEQERVFNAIKDSFKGELYFDDADTFIQTVKNNLQNKGK